MDSVYSIRVKAGKRRTYFFDVRSTRGSDYYITITESRKRFDSDGYDRHKIFLYKEDFNKFLKGLNETVEYVKTELMPDFDFDAFNHDTPYEFHFLFHILSFYYRINVRNNPDINKKFFQLFYNSLSINRIIFLPNYRPLPNSMD